MKVAVGNDHRGYKSKIHVINWLTSQRHEVIDCGSNDEIPSDYPDYARKVGEAVSKKVADFGVLICGTGIGMCMTANKIRNIRAALCYQPEYAVLTRKHNNANILCIGELNGDSLNLEVLESFMNTDFEGGRHQRRIEKIDCNC